ncbi:MAG TPA: rhodanese-like domain-containing protein [Balneolales bacterium]|nr:rhodanese-like domain-containing protein [Balneolales bacterium]
MIKTSARYYVVALALLIAFILAFFPTSAFVHNPWTLDTHLKQQHYNEAGLYTVTSFEAGQFYTNDQTQCYWIDVRDTAEFSKSHLKIALNQTLKQLENTAWKPDNLILLYGDNTRDAQKAAAYLRQVKNARAFAIEGGYAAVKKYLIDPIGISVTNQFSDQQLTTLIEARNKLSGQKISPEQLLNNLKSSKPAAKREGC